MGVYIEQGPRFEGPSKLDEQLEKKRDRETGKILLTRDEAKDILLETLLAYYRKSVRTRELPEEIYPLSPKSSTKIETLVQIVAGLGGEQGLFDYDRIKGELDSMRTEEEREERHRLEEGRGIRDGLMGSRETPPTRPEI